MIAVNEKQVYIIRFFIIIYLKKAAQTQRWPTGFLVDENNSCTGFFRPHDFLLTGKKLRTECWPTGPFGLTGKKLYRVLAHRFLG